MGRKKKGGGEGWGGGRDGAFSTTHSCKQIDKQGGFVRSSFIYEFKNMTLICGLLCLFEKEEKRAQQQHFMQAL